MFCYNKDNKKSDICFAPASYKKSVFLPNFPGHFLISGQSYALEHLKRCFEQKGNRVSVTVGQGLNLGKVYIKQKQEKFCMGKCHKKITELSRANKGICQSCRYNEIIPMCGFCKQTNVPRMHKCVSALPFKYEKTVNGKPVKKMLCKKCPPHMYYSYGAYGRHTKRAHGMRKEWKCNHNNCGATFFTLNNLNSHKKKHASPTHKCPECSKLFKHQSDKSKHMLIAHPHVKRDAAWVHTSTKNMNERKVPLQSKVNNEFTSINQFISL